MKAFRDLILDVDALGHLAWLAFVAAIFGLAGLAAFGVV